MRLIAIILSALHFQHALEADDLVQAQRLGEVEWVLAQR
jgi:hypothetical protein